MSGYTAAAPDTVQHPGCPPEMPERHHEHQQVGLKFQQQARDLD